MSLRDRTALSLAALAVLQLLHLLDELRSDPTTDVLEVLLRPQPIVGIGGTVVALVMVRRGAPHGRMLALWTAGAVAFGFVLSHGIPVESARTKPYWGDGSADIVQWLGVSLILLCCVTVASLARRLPRSARESAARSST